MEVDPRNVHYLRCMVCGKNVSTGYLPLKTDTPDGGIIVRAFVECPECIENRANAQAKPTC